MGDMQLDVTLDIKEKSFIALTGMSGCGKTTLLKILAGLESASGSVKMGDDIWLDEGVFVKPQNRNIGFVFQDYALFPNMSIIDNLLFVRKDYDLANYLLNVVHLNVLKDRLPNTLSGGQKQRVAFCRSMMTKPRLLLMDEPLSALDANMQSILQDEILALHQEFNTTTIMVSHNSTQIYKLSDRVIVLDNGKIINDAIAKEILLPKSGSQKFCLKGEIVDLFKVDVINIAIISLDEQLVEIVLSNQEVSSLEIGQKVIVGTKAFAPTVSIIKDML